MKILAFIAVFLVGMCAQVLLDKLVGTKIKRENAKLIKYRAEVTGVNWYAVHNDYLITPWCMSPLSAFGEWCKGEVYDVENDKTYQYIAASKE